MSVHVLKVVQSHEVNHVHVHVLLGLAQGRRRIQDLDRHQNCDLKENEGDGVLRVVVREDVEVVLLLAVIHMIHLKQAPYDRQDTWFAEIATGLTLTRLEN